MPNFSPFERELVLFLFSVFFLSSSLCFAAALETGLSSEREAIRSRLLFLIGAGLIGACADELFKLNIRSSKLGFLPPPDPGLPTSFLASSDFAILGILGKLAEEGVGSPIFVLESSRSFCASSLIFNFSVESSLSRISVSLYGFDSLFFSFLSFSFCLSLSFSFLLRSSLCLSFSLSLLCLCLSLSFLSPFSSPFRLSSLFSFSLRSCLSFSLLASFSFAFFESLSSFFTSTASFFKVSESSMASPCNNFTGSGSTSSRVSLRITPISFIVLSTFCFSFVIELDKSVSNGSSSGGL